MAIPMRKVTFYGVLSVAFVLTTFARLRAGEEKLSPDQLPKAVLDAAKAKFADAKIVGATKEVEDGKPQYEVSIEKDGQHLVAIYTETGTLTAVEKTITAKELPKPVRRAIKQRYPKSKIKKVEEITKEDKVAEYEALVITADKKTIEAVFDTTGKFVKEEQKESESKEKGEK
jgi:hypothetical protein